MVAERIWRLDLLIRNMVLDPGDEETRKAFELEIVQQQNQGFDNLVVPATKDVDYTFDAVKNAELIFIQNKSRTENIFFRINGLYENIPLESFTILSNGPSWGRLNKLSFKSLNQEEDADIQILILGTEEEYSGNGNP